MRGVPFLLLVALVGWSGCLDETGSDPLPEPPIDGSTAPLAFLPSTVRRA